MAVGGGGEGERKYTEKIMSNDKEVERKLQTSVISREKNKNRRPQQCREIYGTQCRRDRTAEIRERLR